MYLSFAIYRSYTVCLPFTLVNLPFGLPQPLRSNTAVNGKLMLTVGNPTPKSYSFCIYAKSVNEKCYHEIFYFKQIFFSGPVRLTFPNWETSTPNE